MPILSGVQKVSLDEFKSNKKDRFYYLVTKSDGPFPQLSIREKVQCFYVPTLTRKISPYSDVLSLFSLIKIIRTVRPEVVHTHSSKPGILGRFSAKVMSVHKVIHTVHGFGFASTNSFLVKFFYFIIEYFASKFTDVMIVMNISDYQFANKYFKNKRCNIEFVNNSIDTSIYFPRRIQDSSYLSFFSKNKIIVGFNGRLDVQKNPMQFIRVAMQLLQNRSDVLFYITGDGFFSEKIRDLITSSNLSDSIYLLGWRNDIPEILRETDILVSTSLYEGMPLNLLEAMASGVAILASKVTGNIDLIKDDINGRLFNLEDDSMLSALLNEMIDSYSLRKRYIEASFEIINNKHTLECRMNRLNYIYNSGQVLN